MSPNIIFLIVVRREAEHNETATHEGVKPQPALEIGLSPHAATRPPLAASK